MQWDLLLPFITKEENTEKCLSIKFIVCDYKDEVRVTWFEIQTQMATNPKNLSTTKNVDSTGGSLFEQLYDEHIIMQSNYDFDLLHCYIISLFLHSKFIV